MQHILLRLDLSPRESKAREEWSMLPTKRVGVRARKGEETGVDESGAGAYQKERRAVCEHEDSRCNVHLANASLRRRQQFVRTR